MKTNTLASILSILVLALASSTTFAGTGAKGPGYPAPLPPTTSSTGSSYAMKGPGYPAPLPPTVNDGKATV